LSRRFTGDNGEQALILIAECNRGALLVVTGDHTDELRLHEQGHAQHRTHRLIPVRALEALVLSGIHAQERFLVEVHPPQEAFVQMELGVLGRARHGAHQGLHGAVFVPVDECHYRLLGQDRAHGTVDDLVDDVL